MKPIKIFYSYSQVDELYRNELEKSLAMLQRSDNLIQWHFREILPGKEWGKEIKTELENSDIILLLVSRDFLFSDYCYDIEVKKAMELYAEGKAIVVPIIVRECDWKDTPFSKLECLPKNALPVKQWHDLDSAFNDITQRLKEVIKEIRQKENPRTKEQVTEEKVPLSSLSDYPKTSRMFTGREEKLKEFKAIYENSTLIAIEGLGGVGKTAFVAKCIEEFIPNKEKIIWLNGNPESKFDVFVQSAGYGDVLKGENKTALALYSGFKDLIERDERIIFWDNFQAIEDNAFNEFIKFAFQYLSKARFIFLTKKELAFGDADISIILLEGLGEDAIEYSKKVRDSNSRFNQISEEELNKLCKYTNGHPLAIKLAIPLMAKGSLADNILETIIKFSAQEGIEELTERIFTNSYNHSTDQEKLLLQKVSVFSDKFRRDAILNIFDNEDIEIPLYGLLDNLLITHLEEFYEIHPLVRIFSYDLLENKEKVHAKAADYFIIQRTENLNPALEAEIFYHLEKSGQWERVESEIEQKGRQFIMIGQLGLIKEYVEKLNLVNIENSIFDIYYGDIYEILGEYKNAKQHFKNASLQDKEPKIKVEGLIKYGEMIFRSGDVKEASDIFEKAYYFSKTNGYLKEEGRALNDIGLIHQNEGELHEAELKHKEAYKIALLADDNQGIVQALINTCSALKSTGKWQEALSYIQKSIEIGERTNDKPGIILSLNHLGSLYFITDLVKSYKTFEQALEIAKEIGDKVGIAESISGIGSVLGKRKEWNKAIQEIKYSIAIAEEIGYNYIIATFLNDLANVYQDKGDWENAIKNYEKSLHIHELEGNKCDLVISHSNIGFAYLDRQMYGDAIVAYLKSLSFTSQMKSNRVNSLNKLNQIREIIGLEEFRKLARAEYSKMSFDKKQLIPIESICKEPRIAGDKLERNDPCYCGSGKKFKKCHGKNE